MRFFTTILALATTLSATTLGADTDQTNDLPYIISGTLSKSAKDFLNITSVISEGDTYQFGRLWDLAHTMAFLVQEFVILDAYMTWEQVDKSEVDAQKVEGVTVAAVVSDLTAGLDNIKARANFIPPEYDTLSKLLDILDDMLGRFAARLNSVFVQESRVNDTNSWMNTFHSKVLDIKTALNASTATQQKSFHWLEAAKFVNSTSNSTTSSTTTSQAAATTTINHIRRWV